MGMIPAITSNAQGARQVETRPVLEMLRRFGAIDEEAPPGAKKNTVPPVSITRDEGEDFYRNLAKAEKLSVATGKEVSESRAFLDDYLRNPQKYYPATGAIEQARAALVLFRIDPASEIAKSTLAELMDFVRESDDSTPDYLGIARGLENLGPNAEPLYPALLLDALTDHEVENRQIAIRALSKIIPSRPTLTANLKRIQVGNWDIHALIANISPSDHELRSEIALALRHPYPSIRERAILVVGVIRSPDTMFLSELERLKRDPDARIRKKASETWENIRNGK
jgi:hypothetical protein